MRPFAWVKTVTLREASILVLALAALTSAGGWVWTAIASGEIISELDSELDCRYDISSEVRRLESLRDGAFADGLIASVTDDDEGLEMAVERVSEANELLAEQRLRDANAVELCDPSRN